MFENTGCNSFLLGFEESFGYLKGTYARDKDAVVASMLVCELAAYLKLQNKSILDALHELYTNYGYYIAKVQNIELTGADAMKKAAKIMSDFREKSPKAIGGVSVSVIRDYQSRTHTDVHTGEVSTIDLPKSNVLEYCLETKGSVIVRPSGTEPKVKFYYTAIGCDADDAKALLNKMMFDMSK